MALALLCASKRNTKSNFSFVANGEQLGTVGTTGNAAGKPPHLHYSIVTPIPNFWNLDTDKQGWKKMFYLNPIDYLKELWGNWESINREALIYFLSFEHPIPKFWTVFISPSRRVYFRKYKLQLWPSRGMGSVWNRKCKSESIDWGFCDKNWSILSLISRDRNYHCSRRTTERLC